MTKNQALHNMISNQILPQKVCDRKVLDAIAATARDAYVPEHLAHNAYSDALLYLSETRYLLPPMVFARMVQEARIKPSDRILDIACGSGYSTAVLAHLAEHVVAIESESELASLAHKAFKKHHVDNILMMSHELALGHPEEGPYDLILINGAVAEIPDSYRAQLKENGKIIALLPKSRYMKELIIATQCNARFDYQTIAEYSIPFISGFEAAIVPSTTIL